MLNKRPTRYPIGILDTIRQLTAAGAERVAINEMDTRQGEHFWEGATDEQKAIGAEFWQELMRERQRRNCEAAQESGCESEGETERRGERFVTRTSLYLIVCFVL